MPFAALKTATVHPEAGGFPPPALTKLDTKKYLPNVLKSLPTTPTNTSPINRVLPAKQRRKYQKPLYPLEYLTFKEYIDRLNDEAERQVIQYKKDHAAERVLHSVRQLRNCASVTTVKHCDCGTPIPGTAKRHAVQYPCNNRVCPACARARSMKLLVWGKEIFEKVKEIKGDNLNDHREYRLITFTNQYEKNLESSLTVKGFRERTAKMKEVWAGVWEALKERYGKQQGAFRSVECEGHGNVHMHVLHWGPFIELEWLQATVRALFGHDQCSIDLKGLQNKDGTPCANIDEQVTAAIEVFKYTVKMPGTKNGKWQGGGRWWIMSPVLMARWLMASHRQRLGERYGVFREVRRPDSIPASEIEQITAAAEYDCHCPACGNTDLKTWRPVKWPTGSWVAYAIANGIQPYPDFTKRILHYGRQSDHAVHTQAETLVRTERDKRKTAGQKRRDDRKRFEAEQRSEEKRTKARIAQCAQSGSGTTAEESGGRNRGQETSGRAATVGSQTALTGL